MNIKLHKLLYSPIALTLTASAFLLPSHASAVACGDVIISPTFLIQPLTCELSIAEPNALTVIGPIGSLTMIGSGGITCEDPDEVGQAGILIEGFSATVSGGEINNCPNGIDVEGGGFHSIQFVEIVDAGTDGIKIVSNSNNITANTVTGSVFGDGIDDNGDYNVITQNQVEGVSDEGIEVNGDFTSVILNHVEGSGNEGIELEEGIGATVSQNYVASSGGSGIELQDGVSNALVTQNTVLENGIDEDPDEAGINILGPDNTDNRIIGNTALDNFEFDLRDATDPLCTGINIWLDNTFVTADPACLN
ncbi:right-handed parallel beta-helix repeat-containing protein [Microbulbifer epialgicus]|uniref:Right-handed parallel beta-helix repeat-containing protein n=1 Tax=Microbulbifer epialgicus TaxID=393907 RepID=A0ABV4NY28_9GAMM